MLRKANWDKTLQKSLKFSDCRKSIRKQIRPSGRKNLSTSFCVCLVSWKQRNLEIRSNILKSCCRPVVSLLYATKSAFTASNLCWEWALASPVTFLTGDHVMQIGFDQIYNLGQNGWKIKTTPPPISMMEKMARFHCSASTSLNWGKGCFYFSFYSVQDCPRSTLALPEVM